MGNRLQTFVAERLKALGLGPVEAATKAGLERTYIRDIVEGKKSSIRTDKIEALARALDLDPARIASVVSGGTEDSIDSGLAELFMKSPHEAERLREDFRAAIERRLQDEGR